MKLLPERPSGRKTSFLLTATLLMLPVGSAFGQVSPADDKARDREAVIDVPRSSAPGKQPFLRYFVQDEVSMWTAPFKKSSYDSRTFTHYVLPFTLVTGALFATDHQISNVLPNTADQSKWSLRVSQIGAPYTLAGISAGMYLISRATHNKKARETGFLGAEAIAHTQIMVQVIKLATQRERPLDYQANNHGGIAFWRGGNSFPSGHAISSFGLATVFAYEYGRDHKWVPFVSYGLASVVAASRLSGQKHWMSDIF